MKKNNWLWWLLALILFAAILRVGLWFAYTPMQTSDRQGYLDVSRMIQHMDFSGNEGARTPVYPAVLALGGLNDNTVWILQMGLGLLISGLLFFFTMKFTSSAALAFVVALLYSLNIPQLFFEATILAETLTTFLFLLTLGLAATLDHPRKYEWQLSVLLGLTLGCTILARPVYIYLVPLYFLYLWWQGRGRATRQRALVLTAFLVPTVVLVGGWSLVNWETTRYFGPTTMTGYYLMNHTVNFIEYAPDKYAVIRDIFLKHRAEQIALTGNPEMTIWRSFNDLTNATGLTYAGLSQLLTELSITLIFQHPFLYLESVANSWLIFWKVTIFWQLDAIKIPSLIPALNTAWWSEKYAIVAANMAFLLLGLYWFLRWIKKQISQMEVTLLLVWIIVFCGSVFQAFLERGENARYAVSFEPIVIWAVVLGIWHIVSNLRASHSLPKNTVTMSK